MANAPPGSVYVRARTWPTDVATGRGCQLSPSYLRSLPGGPSVEPIKLRHVAGIAEVKNILGIKGRHVKSQVLPSGSGLV
jgi:hypothetical protein